MSACVGGHVAYAADLTIPSGGILALLRPPAISASWSLLEEKRTSRTVDCNAAAGTRRTATGVCTVTVVRARQIHAPRWAGVLPTKQANLLAARVRASPVRD